MLLIFLRALRNIRSMELVDGTLKIEILVHFQVDLKY